MDFTEKHCDSKVSPKPPAHSRALLSLRGTYQSFACLFEIAACSRGELAVSPQRSVCSDRRKHLLVVCFSSCRQASGKEEVKRWQAARREKEVPFSLINLSLLTTNKQNGNRAATATTAETDDERKCFFRIFVWNSNREFETKTRPDERCSDHRRINYRFWYFCFP